MIWVISDYLSVILIFCERACKSWVAFNLFVIEIILFNGTIWKHFVIVCSEIGIYLLKQIWLFLYMIGILLFFFLKAEILLIDSLQVFHCIQVPVSSGMLPNNDLEKVGVDVKLYIKVMYDCQILFCGNLKNYRTPL